MRVVPISKKIAELFVTQKHYSRHASIFWEGFALIESNKVTGICVFGQPSPSLQKYAFTTRNFRLYELTRLVVQSKTKNASSFLVSHALSQLSVQPCAVVSFADSEQGHCGYIYQATNWIYTGSTVSHDSLYLIDGKRVHPMTLRDQGITNIAKWALENHIERVKPFPKHRYFFFVGSRSEKKAMRSFLKYPIVAEYPKSSDAPPVMMTVLF